MFALGGPTHSHVWSDFEFVESHPRLSVGALHRAGALWPGSETEWTWANGLKVRVRTTHGQIFLTGDRDQIILIDWVPILKSRFARPRLLCGCGRGAYFMHDKGGFLHDKGGLFACRYCCRYDYRSRHRQRFSPAFRHIARLRRKLGADPRPLSPLPPPRQRMSRARYARLAAALARAETIAYGDLGRLLADLDQRP
jgi:hypothetical protein